MFAYHHRPGDGRDLLKDAEQDEEEEDGGEEPQRDGHKQDPAVRREQCVRPAGYQRPVEHPHKLDTGDKMWPESCVIVTAWVSEQSSKLARWDLRNASSVCFTVLIS